MSIDQWQSREGVAYDDAVSEVIITDAALKDAINALDDAAVAYRKAQRNYNAASQAALEAHKALYRLRIIMRDLPPIVRPGKKVI